MENNELSGDRDVVVIGGGAAGLSAGLMLARARRSVVVLDAGAPRNAPAAEVHGLFGRDGTTPADLLATGRAEVRRYGGEVVSAEVAAVTATDDGLVVAVTDGRSVRARRLLVTTGIVDELPAVAGLAQRWGRDVMHCPYCHGWENRDRVIAVLGTGPMAVHQALLLRQWSADIVLICHSIDEPQDGEADQLAARGIDVVVGTAESLEIEDDHVVGVRLADGRVVACQTVAVGPRARVRTGFLPSLPVAEHPSGMGEFVPADATGRTEVAGVWVAGNVADLAAQVGSAAAMGATAAAHINADLVAEDTRDAVHAVRSGSPA